MDNLDRSKEVRVIASQMGVQGVSPTLGIIDTCLDRVASWIKNKPVKTFSQLEELVCEKLNLVFEMIHCNEDLNLLAEKYAKDGDPAFGYIKNCFDEKTFGTLFRRSKTDKKGSRRYVAFIDCRGDKAQRSYFSKWHEISHVMTDFGQMEMFHRSTSDKDDTEQLMDRIAGELGFYDDIFDPILKSEMVGKDRLTFDVVEKVQSRICDQASFQSTLIACCKRIRKAIVYVEAAMKLKKNELQALESNQDDFLQSEFADSMPTPKLRAWLVKPNKQALNEGIDIHRNMLVPENSVIYRLYNSESGDLVDAQGYECLGDWKHSNGSTLEQVDVYIEARKYKDSLYALVSPA